MFATHVATEEVNSVIGGMTSGWNKMLWTTRDKVNTIIMTPRAAATSRTTRSIRSQRNA